MDKQVELKFLRKLTNESKKRTNELILNEKYLKEVDSYEATGGIGGKLLELRESLVKNNAKEDSENSSQIKGDVRLQAGKKLPKMYRKYLTRDLIGTPLEEIDDYWKNDHVN